MSQPPLVLIGPMAAGKTRTGKRLARRLGLEFRDTDRMVEADHGPIPEIFETQGERAFRAFEREAVSRALAAGGVVAFGGGAVLDPDTQADLAECAVVYLSTTAEAVASRIANDRQRPLLADDSVARWEAIFAERRDLYQQLGRIHVDTSHRPMDAIADELAAWYRSRYGLPHEPTH